MKICELDDCHNRHHGDGYCKKHYSRYKRHGNPLEGRVSEGVPRVWLDTHKEYDRDNCLIWPFGMNKAGYGQIASLSEDKCRTINAHVAMCELAHGIKPDGKDEVAHSCGNKSCINPKHLRWATRSENQADKLLHGTDQFGERNKRVKLTEQIVLKIVIDTRPRREIAQTYGVSHGAIDDIKSGRNWGWLTGKGGVTPLPLQRQTVLL